MASREQMLEEALREGFVSWLSGAFPQSWPRWQAELAWQNRHVAALAWQEQAARSALSTPAEPSQPHPAHFVAVNKAALQMVRNALRTDAKNGKPVRGEMLKELDKATRALDEPRTVEPLTNADVVEGWRTTEALRDDYGWTSCEWFQAGVRFAQRHYGIGLVLAGGEQG